VINIRFHPASSPQAHVLKITVETTVAAQLAVNGSVPARQHHLMTHLT
jgi:hypothetical protein